MRLENPIDPDDRMMKILVSSYKLISSSYGGGEVYIRNLIAGLSGHGHHVIGMSLAFTDVQEPQRLWFRHDIFEEVQLSLPKGWMIGSHENHEDSRVQRELALLLKEIAPDIIHANGWKQDISLAGCKAGIACVVTAHHGGIVCPAGALLNADDEICQVPVNDVDCPKCCAKSIPGYRLWYPLLRLMPFQRRIRFGRWVEKRPFIPFLTPFGKITCSILEKGEAVAAMASAATRFIAPSPAIGEALVRNGVPEAKVLSVPHGIPLPAPVPRPVGLEGRPVKFLYVGRISYVKGLHVLLEACRELPHESYELHVVGNAVTNPEERYFQRLQNHFPEVNVVWHGGKAHEEVPQMLAASDVLVHPAICLEVFGLTIAEALAVGRPVIASRCGGAEIQIQDGINGLLVPPNNPLALRRALLRLIESPDHIRDMAQRTGPVNSIENHVDELMQIYRECYEKAPNSH